MKYKGMAEDFSVQGLVVPNHNILLCSIHGCMCLFDVDCSKMNESSGFCVVLAPLRIVAPETGNDLQKAQIKGQVIVILKRCFQMGLNM